MGPHHPTDLARYMKGKVLHKWITFETFRVLALSMSRLAIDDLCEALGMLLYEWLLIVNLTLAALPTQFFTRTMPC